MKHRGPGNRGPAGNEKQLSSCCRQFYRGKSDSSLRFPSPILLAHRFRIRLFNYAVDNNGKNETKNMQLTWIPKLSPTRIERSKINDGRSFCFQVEELNMNFCNHRVIYILFILVSLIFVSLVSRVLNFK